MGFKIIVSPNAQNDIEKAIDFYVKHSEKAPGDFIKTLAKSYDLLALNPFFEIRYKNIRSLKLRKFPFSLYFTVNKERQIIRILSCFHNNRDPQNLPDF